MIDLGGTTVPIGGMTLIPEDGFFIRSLDGNTFLRSGVLVDAADYPTFPHDQAINSTGLMWESRALPTTDKWSGLCRADTGRYVAIAKTDSSNNETNRALTSMDGINWTTVTLPITASWSDVCWGGGMFVASRLDSEGSSSSIKTLASSPDGINWTSRDVASAGYTSNVRLAYGNGMFVIAGSTSLAARSFNGITWEVAASVLPTGGIGLLAFGAGTFVGINGPLGNKGNVVLTSTNGLNWSSHTMPVSAFWWSLIYADGKFVAVGNNTTNVNQAYGAVLAVSIDGVTWELKTLPTTTVLMQRVGYANGLFVVLTGGGNLLVSTDCETWGMRKQTKITPTDCFSVGDSLLAVEQGFIHQSDPGLVVGSLAYSPNHYMRIA